MSPQYIIFLLAFGLSVSLQAQLAYCEDAAGKGKLSSTPKLLDVEVLNTRTCADDTAPICQNISQASECMTEVEPKDVVQIKWMMNPDEIDATSSNFDTVEIFLCYSPNSILGRPWRKIVDEIKSNKQCLAYSSSGTDLAPSSVVADLPWEGTTDYSMVVPPAQATGTYFVRVYALDSAGNYVGYGSSDSTSAAYCQTATDSNSSSALGTGCGYFAIKGDSGITVPIIITAATISVSALLILGGALYIDFRGAYKHS